MITITRLLLIGCLSIGARFQFTNGFQTANSTDDLTADCTICPTMELVSEGGFAEMYPRYLGVWGIVGYYHGLPYYRCGPDCEGLQDKLVILLVLKLFSTSYIKLCYQIYICVIQTIM